MNLVKAELFKLRTTSLWWIFGIILIPLWAASLLLNWANENAQTTGGDADGAPQVARTASEVATDLYTSGQFFGVLLVLLLSAIIVTNEFFHLTATTTFLVTPRRERVILAKFVAAIVAGLIAWAVVTVLDLIFVPIILNQLDFGAQLGDGAVWRAIGLNALAFVLWSVLGVGAGVLIRSQIAATLTLSILYVVGTQAVALIFYLLSEYVWKWAEHLQVLVPTSASQLMISGVDLPGDPPRWLGAVVLIGYALVTGFFGTIQTKSRDIS
jgi:ABC-2 type transport system permease protein